MNTEEKERFALEALRSPMKVTISGNLAAYLRMLAVNENEVRESPKIALDCIVESIVGRVKADSGFASRERIRRGCSTSAVTRG